MYTLFNEFGRAWVNNWQLYSYFQILDQPLFRVFAAAVLAFAIVLVMGKAVIAWLRRKRIGDTGVFEPGKKNTPTMGGILIVGAVLAATAVFANVLNFYVMVGMIVLVWMAAIGAADDWLKLTALTRAAKAAEAAMAESAIGASGGASAVGGDGAAQSGQAGQTGLIPPPKPSYITRQGLYSWEKLVFQLGLAVLVAFFIYNHGDTTPGDDMAHVLNLPFQKTYATTTGEVATGLLFMPRWIFVIIAVMMIAGMSNAVNITDGMDGLASGTAGAVALGLLVLVVIAGTQGYAQYLRVPFVDGSDELAIMAGAMAGACLGFLWWNCWPASVFMGDTGSLALGGMIGYIAVVVRQEVLVLFMCGVFLIEIGSVVMQVAFYKATKGRRIFKCAPFHHHLHDISVGWPEQQIVARAWIIAVLLVVLALASIKIR